MVHQFHSNLDFLFFAIGNDWWGCYVDWLDFFGPNGLFASIDRLAGTTLSKEALYKTKVPQAILVCCEFKSFRSEWLEFDTSYVFVGGEMGAQNLP